MATVISNDNLEAYNVNKYNFKIITSNENHEKSGDRPLTNNTLSEEASKPSMKEVDSSALSNSSKESLIESLMQKTDEMSSNFIKLQMKLESKEEEYKIELQKAKETAFGEGVAAGLEKAKSDSSENTLKSIDLFSSSVIKLEDSANEFESALEGIKKELIAAALDISKEVLKVELSDNSNEIAKLLANELLKDLQSASKITLKVNPKNHGAISEHVGSLEHISVLSDSAINEGGVIVISDAGNIDSQISKRFERVKRAALSE